MCIKKLLGWFTPKAGWKPTEYPLTSQQVFDLVKDSTSDHVYMWDSQYWAVSLDDWKRIIKDVLSDLPKYLAEKFDCEDFAMLTMTRIAERYEINTMGVAVGQVPFGYHGYDLFVAWEDGQPKLHVLEPQTSEIDPAGYMRDTVIFC